MLSWDLPVGGVALQTLFYMVHGSSDRALLVVTTGLHRHMIPYCYLACVKEADAQLAAQVAGSVLWTLVSFPECVSHLLRDGCIHAVLPWLATHTQAESHVYVMECTLILLRPPPRE